MASVASLGFSIISRYSGGGVRQARTDLAALRAQMATLNNDLKTHTNLLGGIPQRWKAIGTAAAAITPALIPIGAAALQATGALVAMAAGVGSALGAYGAAMKGAITSTMEMAKAHKALSPVQKEFVQSVNSMKSAWQGFIKDTQGQTLASATNVVQGLAAGIKLLKPLIDAVHPSVLQVTKDFETWMKGDSAKNYSNILAGIAKSSMPLLIAAGKNLLNVLGDGFRAFAPLADNAAAAILRGAQSLSAWSDGGGFQRFLQYVKDNSPAVQGFFSALGAALKNVFNILAGFSGASLSILTDALKGIASIDPESVKAFAQAMLLLRSPVAFLVLNCPPLRDAMIGLLGAMNPATIYAVVGAFVALRIAFMVMNTALLTTPLGWLILGLTALAVAVVYIATKTTWFQTAWSATWSAIQTATSAVWTALQVGFSAFVNAMIVAWQAVSGALVTAWNAVWQGLSTAASAVWTGLQTAWTAFTGALATAWTAVSTALVTAWQTVWTGLQTAAQTVWTALQTGWSAFTGALATAWTTVSTALTTAWNAVWTGLQTAAQAVWTAIQTAWQAVCNAFSTAWSAVSGALQAAWSAFWNALQTAAQAIWTALQAAWQGFLNAVQTAWSTISGAIQTAWSAFWNALQTAAQAIWTALQTAWQAFLTAVQTAWNTLSAALTAAWNAFWNAVKTAAQTIWTAMQTAWQAFLTAIQTAWTTLSTALTTAWNAFWNAIKSAAQAIWTAMQTAWDGVTKAIGDIWDKASSALKKAWQETWDTIKDVATKVWDGVKDAVEKGINALLKPINALIGGFNKICDAVGLDIKIPTLSVSFENGGMVGGTPTFAVGGTVNFARGGGALSGFAPGRDTVPAILSRGEGVLTPEAVRGIGGAGMINSLNRKFAGHRGAGRGAAPLTFATGGMLPASANNFSGATQAWHRSGGKEGWGFADGGPVVPGPGIGGGDPITKNLSKAGDDDNILKSGDDDDGGGVLGFLKDAASGVAGVLTGGLLGEGGGTASLVLGFIGKEALEKGILPLIDAIVPHFGPVGEILGGTAKKIGRAMLDWLIKKDEDAKKEYEAHAVAGAQSVQAWAPVVMQALKLAGAPASWLPGILALMSAESGGNPNAINGWDVNAKNGVPSQGLMQVIPPTFAAYHQPGTSNNILDPLANIAAAINYIQARYGYVPGSPYALGTPGATSGVHLVGEQGPELVNFAGGETVTPAGETASILSGAGTPAAMATAAPAAMGSTGGGMGAAAGGSIGSPEDVNALIQSLLESSEELQSQIDAMWKQVIASTNSGWQSVNGDSLTPLNAALSGTVPASLTAMQGAWTTGWTATAATATAQWTAMNGTAFVPLNAMMSTTVPAAATTMSTGVTDATTQMQTGVQGSWDGMLSGTQSTWTGISGAITESVDTATVPINGLLGGFNNVSSALGMGISVPLIAYEAGGVAMFSTGGMLAKKGGAVPGFSPGRDTFPAMLSPGEGVLTPEAVRGLGGPGFVFAANRKFSGHRGGGGSSSEPLGKYMGKYAQCGHARGGMAGVMGADGRQHFASGTISAFDAEGLAAAGVDQSAVVQGSFNSSVAASGSTHSGDGVVDLTDLGAVSRLRDAGWAAWERGPDQGFSPHVHAVYMKATGVDPSAMGQEMDFINGGDGLPAGSASSAETAKWGLNLGKWDFGPLVKSIIDGAVTTVPTMLKPLVKKHITKEQVESGFSTLKSALDGTDMGTGPFAESLMGVGTSTYSGIIDSVSSQVQSFDRGGYLRPGLNFAYNGTGKPEPVGHDLVPRGGHGGDIHLTINVDGNLDHDAVDRIENDVLPQLLIKLKKQ